MRLYELFDGPTKKDSSDKILRRGYSLDSEYAEVDENEEETNDSDEELEEDQ